MSLSSKTSPSRLSLGDEARPDVAGRKVACRRRECAGSKRWGHFSCPGCRGRGWGSKHAYEGYAQECKRCGQAVMPGSLEQ